MSARVQLRRDIAANIAAFTPAIGELLYAIDTKALTVGDGATAGGNPIGQPSYNVANIINYGADPTGVADSTAAINAALATGLSVYCPGTFAGANYKVDSGSLVFNTSAQLLFGDGRGPGVTGGTRFIFSVATGRANGLLEFLCGEPGPRIQDIALCCVQPDTSTRARLTNYPPVIFAQNCPRFSLTRVGIYGGIVAIDMRGNSGGVYIDDLQTACFGTIGATFVASGSGTTLTVASCSAGYIREGDIVRGTGAPLGCVITAQINGTPGGPGQYATNVATTCSSASCTTAGGQIRIDGSEDTVRIFRYHDFPTTLTANQQDIFYDAATIGIQSGRCDDIAVVVPLFLSGTGMYCFYGTEWASEPGPTFGSTIGAGFDTYNGIVCAGASDGLDSGPWLQMPGSYFTIGSNAAEAIVLSGGHIEGNGTFENGSSNTTCTINATTAGRTDFTWAGSRVINNAEDCTNFNVGATGGVGTFFNITGLNFYHYPNTSLSQDVIYIGPGARASIGFCRTEDKGTGSGRFINVYEDDWHNISHNTAPGWTLTLPAAGGNGIYAYNNTAAGHGANTGN